ncbi:MAG: DNA primase [Candidatus Latescibacterota bacterium]|nr:DNA primase [Candidatus Latescibacterota bacterium]
MPLIPEETIERVKAATDIVEVVSEHVQMRQAGRNWLGLCPFHNEKTPSFNVQPELQIYHCFGCGVGGDVVKFLQEIDRVSFVEAVTFLAERAGIPVPRSGGSAAEDERNDQLFRANELAAKYFHYMLRQPAGADALRYLHKRGLTDETIDEFRIGYSLPGWSSLLEMAGRRGFPAQALELAGLVVQSPKGRGHYDRFRDRVIFPITNLSGRTIAFGARALRPDDQPKYLNSSETPIYHKSGVLYGMSHARESIRRQGTAIVVEGYMDVVSLAQGGVANVIASSGTALTGLHARLLARYAERVVLLFDGDAAGGTAAQRGVEVLLATEIDTRIVTLPTGQDPDSFVRRDQGADELRQLIDKAPPALDIYLDRLAADIDVNSVTGRAKAIDRLLPLISECRDEVRRSLMLRRAAQRFDVDEQALRTALTAAQKRPAPRRGTDPQPDPEDRVPPPTGPPVTVNKLEREFAGLLLQYPRFLTETARRLDMEVFTDSEVRRLLVYLVDTYNGGQLDLTTLLNAVDESLSRLVRMSAMETFAPENVNEIWADHVNRLQRESLTRQIDAARRDIRRVAETVGPSEKLDQLRTRQNEFIAARMELEAQRGGAVS